jgi:uncharacterized protein YdeI (YjbR/CyaY-like superfamily)
MATDEEPILEFGDPHQWERWLDAHHADATGIWMKIAKKGAPAATTTHPEALEVAIRYGWIDAVRRRHDEHYFLQRFTPRGPRSRWSQINRAKAQQMIDEGRMAPSGLADVERAKADGRWAAAYPAQSQAEVPPDFQAALDAHPEAKAFFMTLTGSNRYAFLHRLHNVKQAENRARRIADYIELLSDGRTLIGE